MDAVLLMLAGAFCVLLGFAMGCVFMILVAAARNGDEDG